MYTLFVLEALYKLHSVISKLLDVCVKSYIGSDALVHKVRDVQIKIERLADYKALHCMTV